MEIHQNFCSVYTGHYWHVPESHDLESWGDARAYDGTISLMQPLIDPLYRSRTASELVGAMIGKSAVTPEDHVKNHWKAAWGLSGKAFDRAWRKALHDGVVADTAAPTVTPTLQPRGVAIAAERLTARLAEAGSGEGQAGTLELSFLLDPSVLDGRYANNGWLQEVPKPMTKLTWDNALLISPATARALGVYEERFHQGDQQAKSPMMRVTVGERTLDVPVWVLPGHASDSATLHLGYGRARAGRVGTGAGFNANLLRDTGNRWRAQATVARVPTRTTYLLASTQDHHSMEGRDIVRQAALAAYKKKPDYMHPHLHTPTDISLMDGKDFPYDGYAWGMSVDLSACVGCNACVIACQAENNIPVVGKDQVLRGREMHWIRIDRYFQGDEDNLTSILQQPVSCVQCEQAPCEVVCPVAATVHSDEGLNDMIYNRCVGTRYCANNCPYKVRRFNFLLYADFETPSLQLARNPDVTVRSRGVMEKCTYCVQRINTARIDAKREGRKIQDGEIKTACQDACPVEGTIFGDINDPNSAVSKAKESPLDYTLLAELGNRPRTTYLARLRNPNPTLEPESLDPYHGHDGHGHGGGDHGDDHGSDHADDAHASLTPSSSPTSSTAPVTA
ncbi:MAG: 4Fe-4S dicluster domain-containing protein [Acidobacteriota bacterium]